MNGYPASSTDLEAREGKLQHLASQIPPELVAAAAAEFGILVLERAVVPILKDAAARRVLRYGLAVGGVALALSILAELLQEEWIEGRKIYVE